MKRFRTVQHLILGVCIPLCLLFLVSRAPASGSVLTVLGAAGAAMLYFICVYADLDRRITCLRVLQGYIDGDGTPHAIAGQARDRYYLLPSDAPTSSWIDNEINSTVRMILLWVALLLLLLLGSAGRGTAEPGGSASFGAFFVLGIIAFILSLLAHRAIVQADAVLFKADVRISNDVTREVVGPGFDTLYAAILKNPKGWGAAN